MPGVSRQAARTLSGPRNTLEPAEGLEPTTYRLQGDCSAIELRRRRAYCTGERLDEPPVSMPGRPRFGIRSSA